jgi:hypothetical protein
LLPGEWDKEKRQANLVSTESTSAASTASCSTISAPWGKGEQTRINHVLRAWYDAQIGRREKIVVGQRAAERSATKEAAVQRFARKAAAKAAGPALTATEAPSASTQFFFGDTPLSATSGCTALHPSHCRVTADGEEKRQSPYHGVRPNAIACCLRIRRQRAAKPRMVYSSDGSETS